MTDPTTAPPGAPCALYYRVSTERQETDSQQSDVAQYVKARGWTVSEIYEEKRSTRGRRPELQRLMQDARRRRFRAVAVWSLDRFGRGLRQIVNNVYELSECGIEFACVKQAIDLSTMQGRLVLYAFAMLAEIERDMLGERIRAGVRASRAKGTRWGVPMVPVDVARARKLVAGGKSISAAARTLGVSRTTLRRRLRP